MAGAKTKDELALECAELLKNGDVEGAERIFGQMLSPEKIARMSRKQSPHFCTAPLPDDDW